jgi:hypothetical protein
MYGLWLGRDSGRCGFIAPLLAEGRSGENTSVEAGLVFCDIARVMMNGAVLFFFFLYARFAPF